MIDVGRAYSFVAHRCKGEAAGMEALIKVFERLESGVERRSWLLYEALRSAPLDEAIELARKADAFIMGTADDGSAGPESWCS
jgi:hypothetical protein